MTQRFERMLSVVLVLSAVAIAGSLVHREFFARPPVNVMEDPSPEYASTWEDAIAISFHNGKTEAPVRIVEFIDYECPVCAKYDSTLRDVVERRGQDLAVMYVHLPLPQHRFARPAARAVECAASLNKLDAFVIALFKKQDSLGLKSWASYGNEAGIADTATFQRCAVEGRVPDRIDAGVRLAGKMGINGTPTILVNGWKVAGGTRSADQLIALIDALRSGKLSSTSSAESVARVLAVSATSR